MTDTTQPAAEPDIDDEIEDEDEDEDDDELDDDDDDDDEPDTAEAAPPELNWSEHSYTSEIVCPWCAHKFSDSYEYCAGGNTERITCGSCEREFECEANVSVDYTTTRVDLVAEAKEKAEADARRAARFEACRQFAPGQRVRVVQGKYTNGSRVGKTGTVANEELRRHNPHVHVVLDDKAKVFVGGKPYSDFFDADELEKIQ